MQYRPAECFILQSVDVISGTEINLNYLAVWEAHTEVHSVNFFLTVHTFVHMGSVQFLPHCNFMLLYTV